MDEKEKEIQEEPEPELTQTPPNNPFPLTGGPLEHGQPLMGSEDTPSPPQQEEQEDTTSNRLLEKDRHISRLNNYIQSLERELDAQAQEMSKLIGQPTPQRGPQQVDRTLLTGPLDPSAEDFEQKLEARIAAAVERARFDAIRDIQTTMAYQNAATQQYENLANTAWTYFSTVYPDLKQYPDLVAAVFRGYYGGQLGPNWRQTLERVATDARKILQNTMAKAPTTRPGKQVARGRDTVAGGPQPEQRGSPQPSQQRIANSLAEEIKERQRKSGLF